MTIRSILHAQLFNPFRVSRVVAYLPQFVRVFYRLMSDERVSFFAKLVPVLGVLILVSPPMLEQDLIPFIGEIDDLVVLFVAFKLFVWLCPPEVVREHVAQISRGA
jgi:uncharacterized membrane protein YkvA (DUF1232 family)